MVAATEAINVGTLLRCSNYLNHFSPALFAAGAPIERLF
jgi:hypothetical protein